jgi:hypothetical protein
VSGAVPAPSPAAPRLAPQNEFSFAFSFPFASGSAIKKSKSAKRARTGSCGPATSRRWRAPTAPASTTSSSSTSESRTHQTPPKDFQYESPRRSGHLPPSRVRVSAWATGPHGPSVQASRRRAARTCLRVKAVQPTARGRARMARRPAAPRLGGPSLGRRLAAAFSRAAVGERARRPSPLPSSPSLRRGAALPGVAAGRDGPGSAGRPHGRRRGAVQHHPGTLGGAPAPPFPPPSLRTLK